MVSKIALPMILLINTLLSAGMRRGSEYIYERLVAAMLYNTYI